jgi:predicted permease
MDFIERMLRGAVRSLLRAPTFAWTTAGLLGLGIGAVTAMFTIVDHIFLRPLPYPVAERLVRVNGSQSHPALRDLRSIGAVEEWAAAAVDDVHLTGSGDPLRIGQARVTDGFFDFFGAQASLGRLLTRDDFVAADVAVVSHGAWERIWGGTADLVGRTVTINGSAVQVVGVLSRSFTPPEALLDGAVADLWRPIDRSDPDVGDRASRSLVVAGRLAPGASLDDARREAADLAERRARDFPDVYVRKDGTTVELPVVSLMEATVGGAKERFRPLVVAVALLLVIACINVAHLFTVRGLGRSREMSVRRALGAGAPALAAQLLAESGLVSALGGALGLLLAGAGVRGFLALTPEVMPRVSEIALDGRVLAFAAALATVVTVIFGLLPALRAMSAEPGSALRNASRNASWSRDARWAHEGLVIAEVALSLVLVFSAGLLARSFVRLAEEPLGFRTADVWTIRVGLPMGDNAVRWTERVEKMADALRGMPRVGGVTYGLSTPLEHIGGTCCWTRPVKAPGVDGAAEMEALIHPYTIGFAEVFEPRVLAGRSWNSADATSPLPPTVINGRVALELFGSPAAALGRTVSIGEADHLVVGVVAEDRHYGPYREHGHALYVPVESVPFTPDRVTLAVRVDPSADDVPRRLREAVWSIEPTLPLPVVRSMEEWARRATARTRFDWWVFATLGASALLLAAAGIYGTVSYAVGQDRRELGIRLALGAGRRSVEGRVLARGLRPTGAGLALGVFGAWASGRLIESRLFGIGAADPATLVSAVGVLSLAAAVACWGPARRAGALDPLETMRAE